MNRLAGWFAVFALWGALLVPSPGWADAYTSGVAAYKQGNYRQAFTQLQRATQENPNAPRVWFYLGLTQAQLGQTDEARSTFEQTGRLLDQLEGTPEADPALSEKVRKNVALLTQMQLAAQGSTQKAQQVARVTARNAASTYLDYAIPDGKVVHWDPKKMPLKVYIASGQTVPGWSSTLNSLVLDGLRTWQNATNGKVRFTQTYSAERADIVVRWKQYLPHSKVGESPFQYWGEHIIRSDVTIATHLSDQRTPMTPVQIRSTILHELGHAIGIKGHSPYPEDLMYFSVTPKQSGDLTARDKATINQLYAMEADIANKSSMSMAQTRKYYDLMQRAVQSQVKQNPASAIAHYREALKLNPTDPDLYYNLALALKDAGYTENAIASYRRVLALDPKRVDAQNNLAILLVNEGVKLGRAGQVTQARGYFQESVTLFSQAAASPKAPPGVRDNLAIAQRNLSASQ